jgi:hypothetical protein
VCGSGVVERAGAAAMMEGKLTATGGDARG